VGVLPGSGPSSSLLILHHAEDVVGVHDKVLFPSIFTSVPEYLAKTTTSPALPSTSSETPTANFLELRQHEVRRILLLETVWKFSGTYHPPHH
jgi:hypothetical protein